MASPAPEELRRACRDQHIDDVRRCIERGDDVNVRGVFDYTPLHCVLASPEKSDQVEIVRLLLDTGADINAVEKYGATPLHLACLVMNVQSVKLLISKGADVNVEDCQSEPPLHTALDTRYRQPGAILDMVSALLEAGGDIKVLGKDALQLARQWEDSKLGGLLLRWGADLDLNDLHFCSKLLDTACSQKDISTVKCLLEKGIDVKSIESVFKKTFLLVALDESYRPCHRDLVVTLIDAGADIHPAGWVGPLHLACCRGDDVIVRLLIDRGADVNARKQDMRSPLQLIFARYFYFDTKPYSEDFYESAEHRALLAALLEAGADVRAIDHDGVSVLHLACQTGTVEAVQTLISRGAGVNMEDCDGNTPLHNLVHSQNTDRTRDVAFTLFRNGANFNAKNRREQTPLAYYYFKNRRTSEVERKKMAELLIANGSDPVDPHDLNSFCFHHFPSRKQPLTIARRRSRSADSTERGDNEMYEAVLDQDVGQVRRCIGRGDDINVGRVNEAPRVARGVQKYEQYDRTRTLLQLALSSPGTPQRQDIVITLIEGGADVWVVDQDRETPLHLACSRGDDVIVSLLINRGADVDAQDRFGRTAFHRTFSTWCGHFVAIENDPCKQVKLNNTRTALTEAGADLRVVDAEGRTALHLACETTDRAAVSLLLSYGVDLGITLPNNSYLRKFNDDLNDRSIAVVLCRAGMECSGLIERTISGLFQTATGNPKLPSSQKILLACYLQFYSVINPHNFCFVQQLEKSTGKDSPMSLNTVLERYKSPADLNVNAVHVIRKRLSQVSGNCSILPRITALGDVLPLPLLRCLRLSDVTDALLENLAQRR